MVSGLVQCLRSEMQLQLLGGLDFVRQLRVKACDMYPVYTGSIGACFGRHSPRIEWMS